jgi:tetratricopeptide (TPR) repeat protein
LLEGNLDEAEKNFRKSIDLNPNYTFAFERLAWISLFKNDEEECLRQYEHVISLDPLSTRLKGSLGGTYYYTERYREGIKRMNKFLESDPSDNYILWSLGVCYAGNKEYQKAIETFHKRSIGTNTNWALSYCYAKLGKMDEVKRILQYHLEKKKTDYVPDFMMAVQYAALGDKKTTLDYLEKSVHNQSETWFTLGYERDPMIALVRNEPRFKALLKGVQERYKL